MNDVAGRCIGGLYGLPPFGPIAADITAFFLDIPNQPHDAGSNDRLSFYIQNHECAAIEPAATDVRFAASAIIAATDREHRQILAQT